MKKIFAILILLLATIPGTSRAQLTVPVEPVTPRQTYTASGETRTFQDFTFKFQDQTFVVPAKTVASWSGTSSLDKTPLLNQTSLTAQNVFSNYFSKTPNFPQPAITYRFRADKVYNYVKSLAEKINIQSQEPSLTIVDNKATEFAPPQEGRSLSIAKSTIDALNALEQGQNESPLTVDTTKPKNSLASLNGLGINELIAEGTSNFAGSPNNRRHNIAVGVEKFKGVIIKQGEEFSFNKYLGEVTKEAGFLPELVIKKTGTVPELGGGLCQVSSTTFRAAMQAGLPITERRNHAYAVQYYAPQGTDATIYPGVVDLKFINDTPSAILIWPYLKDKNNLVFDFYGTKDNRQVTLEKPVQYDRQSNGAMKASWTRIVVKNGETSSSTFKSIYQPPSLYHKEETFVAPTTPTTPTTPPQSTPQTSPQTPPAQ